MIKRFIAIKAFLALIIGLGVSLPGNTLAQAQEASRLTTTQPSIFAPSGLSAKEQSALERQHRYEARQKNLIMTPSLPELETGEEEKLYRYFGVAAGLRKDGRFEEAAEILRYILDKNPDNDYVRVYLEAVREEMRKQKEEWKIDTRREASRLREKRIKDFTQEGIAYYKRGDFDAALLKFSDVLSLEADNQTAKEYMEKLKKYYFKEIKMERLAGEATQSDKVVKNLLYEEEMEYVALNKKAERLLNQAELASRIEETISLMKAEERRSRQLTLGPGDTVRISVLDHPELSGNVTLQLKGEIILPLVNDTVMAGGLTVEDLTEKVTEAMGRYVQEPRVNIAIVEYKSKVFYVIDEISCTPFPIMRADLTLRDALFIADWGDNRALGRVLVMRPSKGAPIVKKVDAFDLIYRGNLENDIRIEDGDVIYIPMTMMAKITKSIGDFLGPFRAARTARDHYLSLKWNEKDWGDILRMPVNYDFQSEDGKDVRFDNDLNLRNVIIRR